MSGPDGLDLLLQTREVVVGRAQFSPEIVSASNGRSAIRITSLVVTLLLTILCATIRLLLSIRVVVALDRNRTDVLLGIWVGGTRLADYSVGRGRVGRLGGVTSDER